MRFNHGIHRRHGIGFMICDWVMRSGSGDAAPGVAGGRVVVQRATTRAYPSSDRFAAHFVRGIFRHNGFALPTANYRCRLPLKNLEVL